MKFLLILSAVALAMGHPSSPVRRPYHETVGIKLAARIKEAESAMDFTGSRVVGGSPSPIGTHPYLAGLLITLQTGQISVCSGALVSHTRVVTAATCHFDGTLLAQSHLVVLGTDTLFAGGWRLPGGIVFMHPGYAWDPVVENDIALITVPWIGYSFWVNQIDMPDSGLLGNDFAGMYAQFAGFGVNIPGTTVQPGQVQHQVFLQVITNAVCEVDYDDRVFPSVLCTSGATFQGPCDGDNGGPLVVVTGGRSVLIGVNSFNPGGADCTAGLPSGFSRITYFAFWINANLS